MCSGPVMTNFHFTNGPTVRPELAYVLLLHFTFASSFDMGHAGCAGFSCSHSAEFSFLPFLQGSVRTEESGSGSLERIEIEHS